MLNIRILLISSEVWERLLTKAIADNGYCQSDCRQRLRELQFTTQTDASARHVALFNNIKEL